MSPRPPGSLPRRVAATSVTLASLATLGFGGEAAAQTANTTVSNVNVLNLLSPFLSLNATPAGQATLREDLEALWSRANVAENSAEHTLVRNEYLQVTAIRRR